MESQFLHQDMFGEDEGNDGTFAWISKTIRMDSNQVFRLAGRDALLFLQFQKQVCIFLRITLALLVLWICKYIGTCCTASSVCYWRK